MSRSRAVHHDPAVLVPTVGAVMRLQRAIPSRSLVELVSAVRRPGPARRALAHVRRCGGCLGGEPELCPNGARLAAKIERRHRSLKKRTMPAVARSVTA
jgi:hypothetical protein